MILVVPWRGRGQNPNPVWLEGKSGATAEVGHVAWGLALHGHSPTFRHARMRSVHMDFSCECHYYLIRITSTWATTASERLFFTVTLHYILALFRSIPRLPH